MFIKKGATCTEEHRRNRSACDQWWNKKS